jgi:adenosylmethionine-8-amino-7-oxononanoate aminotransferase
MGLSVSALKQGINMTEPNGNLGHGYDVEQVRDAIRENVWLHYTNMKAVRESDQKPLVLVKGKDSTVWDSEGNAYIDCLAGIYSVNAGYGRREIAEAMMAQLEQIPFVNPFGYTSVPTAVFADRLGELAPLGGNARIFFTSGGGEAVESALKIAKKYQTAKGFPHRYKTISRRGAWHGTTVGALSVNGIADARNGFGPLVPGARHVAMSHRYRCPYCKDQGACNLTCYDEVERAIEFEGADTVAAIIMEPVQNAGGCIPPGSMDYFRKIRKLCDETGILMIMDEVICGFGRLGELFASTYYDVVPDMITTAKGITSSYAPLGAVMARKDVSDTIDEHSMFNHGITFGGHAVACAAGIANLDIMLNEDLPGKAKETGQYLRDQLEARLGNHPNVGDIRGAGLFLGVEMVKDKATKETLPYDADILQWMTDDMRGQGLILRNDGRGDPTTQLCPPLVITREECDRVVDVLEQSFNKLGRELGTIGTPVSVA